MKYHQETYGNKTYDDFIPEWKAESYDPEEWAIFARKMGAGYIFITSKHHDGFCPGTYNIISFTQTKADRLQLCMVVQNQDKIENH